MQKRKLHELALCGAAALLTATVGAQGPDLSGTWRLDPSRSQVSPGAALAGLNPAGPPDTLHITQASNGTLVIESQINESHSRIYKPGGKTSTPVGQAGSITMTSRREGRTLVGEGRQETTAGASTLVKDVKEVIALSADGRTLTIEVTTSGSDEKSASTLVYTRTHDVGPCKTWPTPCKSPSAE